MKGVFHIIVIVAIGYAALVVLVYWQQASMVYLPIRGLTHTPATIGLKYETLRIATEDGETLHGWFVPACPSAAVAGLRPGLGGPACAPRGTLLFLHGNAGNISHRLESIAVFHRLALDVLIIDYRGYGESSGTPTEEGTYRDALAAWRYLTDTRGTAARKIVIFGRSLGASVAAWLAARVEPGAVILESAFTSAKGVADDHYYWLPTRWLIRYRYDTRAYVSAIRWPLLIVHSAEDEIIGFHHAQQIFDAAHAPKDMLVIRGGHNEGFVVSGSSYTDGLARFLDQYLPLTR